MSRATDLVCPSGLVVKLRSVKGKDLDSLRDKRRVASGEAITELLNDCTIELGERAIYSKLPQFDWADALVGDRTFAVIGLRIATAGDTFEFKLRCQDRDCRQMINWAVELSSLDAKPLPEESKEIYARDNIFKTVVAGREVLFGLNTGRDQLRFVRNMEKIRAQMMAEAKRNPKAAKKADQMKALLGLVSRIGRVEGVDNVLEWLEDLDLAEIKALIKAFEAVDCGVETGIDIVCQGPDGCGLIQEVELPLDNSFFETL